MPNRIIKESICVSDSIDSLSWFEEVLFYRLIVNCDDYGRFDGRAAVIKSRLFPLKDSVTVKAVSDAINKLASAELVTLYVFEGKPYLYLPTWDKHQQVRARRSKYPEPSSDLISSDTICNQMISDVPVIQSESESNPNPKEGVRAARFTPPTVDEVRDYCRERGNTVDAERFVDFYAAKGWMVGKNRMKDWKAAVRTWEKEDGDGKRRSQPRGVDREEAQRSDSKWGITYST